MQIRWHKATPDDLDLLTSTQVEVLCAVTLLPPDLQSDDAYTRGITAVSMDASAMGKPLYVSHGFVSMPMELELPCP